MLAAPYFLMSAGVVLILIAMFWGSLSGGNSTFIDPRMSDEDIEKELNKSEGDPIPGIIFMVGIAAVGISIVWRIIRIFV